jgi:hypothetical protein
MKRETGNLKFELCLLISVLCFGPLRPCPAQQAGVESKAIPAGNLPVSVRPGLLGDSGVAAESLGAAPLFVADNAAKLALSGLTEGQQVVITNEGNRVEMFMGTSEASDANWNVLVNTVRLRVVQDTGSMVVNGITCASGTTTIIGWFRAGSVVPVTNRDTTFLYDGYFAADDPDRVYIPYTRMSDLNPSQYSDFFMFYTTAPNAATPVEYIKIPTYISPRVTLDLYFEGS